MFSKLRRFTVFALLSVLLAFSAVLCASAEEGESELLSPGLNVIAARCELVVSSAPGGDAIFSAETLARAVGYEPETVRLTSRPTSAVGQLTMGGIVIPEGQVLSAKNFSRVSFRRSAMPTQSEASFTFRADGSAYDYICVVRLIESENRAPSLDCATAAALSAKVPEGGICGGTLAASDPDGDALVFEITDYPRHGSVILADRESGRYIYRPTEGYTGKDHFTYTVRDEWGNYSGEAKVSLTVSRFSEPEFADMSGSAETFARIVSAEGLMSGTLVGGKAHFYPDREVSRSEFVLNLMLAAGYSAEDLQKDTVFADNDDIPVSARPIIARAYELGLTDGWIEDGKQVFLPNEAISVAEAARMTARLLELDIAIEASATLGEASWAKYEIAALCAAGFSVDRSDISSSKLLTRASAAELLCGVLKIKEGKR